MRRFLLKIPAIAALAAAWPFTPLLAAERPVMIFAAASLQDVLNSLAADGRKSGRPDMTISYAGSNTLARQIEQGAPADIFISADAEWIDYLSSRKLLREGSVTPLLHNRLVLIGRPGATPVDLADNKILPMRLNGGRLALADTASVPAGRYARKALESLGLWAGVSNHLAPADNVRSALLYVARGEAPLGIVYETDARADSRVSIAAHFPAGSYPPVIYPAAIVKDSANPQTAAVFEFLKSPQAQKNFESFGFTLPGKPGT